MIAEPRFTPRESPYARMPRTRLVLRHDLHGVRHRSDVKFLALSKMFKLWSFRPSDDKKKGVRLMRSLSGSARPMVGGGIRSSRVRRGWRTSRRPVKPH